MKYFNLLEINVASLLSQCFRSLWLPTTSSKSDQIVAINMHFILLTIIFWSSLNSCLHIFFFNSSLSIYQKHACVCRCGVQCLVSLFKIKLRDNICCRLPKKFTNNIWNLQCHPNVIAEIIKFVVLFVHQFFCLWYICEKFCSYWTY